MFLSPLERKRLQYSVLSVTRELDLKLPGAILHAAPARRATDAYIEAFRCTVGEDKAWDKKLMFSGELEDIN